MDAVSREIAHILNQCGYPLSFPGQFYYKDDTGIVLGVQSATADVYEAGWKDNGAGGKQEASSDNEIRMAAPTTMEAIHWIEKHTPTEFTRVHGYWVVIATMSWDFDNPIHTAVLRELNSIVASLNSGVMAVVEAGISAEAQGQ